MNDEEFFELQLRATIVPQQVRWPTPEHLHWQRLHEAVNEARERVRKAYLLMDEIDRRAERSRDDISAAQQDCGSSDCRLRGMKTLVRAREAVELAVAKRNCEGHVSPEIARDTEATLNAMKELEQRWQKGIDKISERAGRTTGPNMRR